MSNTKKEKCFVMMPFTTPTEYKDEDHFKKIYKQIFIPAIEKAGYEPHRVDEDKISDSIIAKIFDSVRNCPMAICDLSSRNPNVLYELGLRQAYNLPVVLVQDDVTERIFDVSGISTVMYKNHRLVENVEEAIESISEALIQTKEGQNKTLASIVKAQGAEYDSIKVGQDDLTQIMLKTLIEDVKELKTIQNSKSLIMSDVHVESEKFKRKIVIELKENVSLEEIKKTINRYRNIICDYDVIGNTLMATLESSSYRRIAVVRNSIQEILGKAKE